MRSGVATAVYGMDVTRRDRRIPHRARANRGECERKKQKRPPVGGRFVVVVDPAIDLFGDDLDLQVSRHVAVNLDLHRVLADRLDRFRQGDLALLDFVSLGSKCVRDVG